MAIPITIPRLGWSMEEGTFAGWLKNDGDSIQVGDVLFTLESEKATEEVECLDFGILRIPAGSPKPGDPVTVGDVIGFLLQPGEAEVPNLAQRGRGESGTTKSAVPSVKTGSILKEGAEVAISPRARRVARELGLDWRNLKGTGRTGRIREQDVRAAIQNGPFQRPTQNQDNFRRIIAERMRHSLNTTAPVTLNTTADVEILMSLRQQLRPQGEPKGPTTTDLFVKLAAAALADHPRLNSRWENGHVVPLKEINISIAVDSEAGLVAPVIRDVPRLTMMELSARSRDLIDRARKGSLKMGEMEGGTFTVSNLGVFGIDAFTPIINWPECAILGIGRIRRQPVVRDNQIMARKQVILSLTFDHRIADGADAARFLQALVRIVENPQPVLTSR